MRYLEELEETLSHLEGFRKPTVKFEQYATDAHLAGILFFAQIKILFYFSARTLFMAHEDFDDIEDSIIADLGCGPGIFTIGSMLLGSR